MSRKDRAVVAEIPRPIDLLRERFGDGFFRARLVAHQLQRDAELHQRQRGQRFRALVVVQRAQRAERRAVDAREHVARIRLVGEAQMIAVFVAVDTDAAGQQIVVETLQRLLQHVVGNREAFVARVLEELDDVRRQDFADVAVAAPHREVSGRNLHRRDAADRAFDARLALLAARALRTCRFAGSSRRAAARRSPCSWSARRSRTDTSAILQRASRTAAAAGSTVRRAVTESASRPSIESAPSVDRIELVERARRERSTPATPARTASRNGDRS